MHSCMTAQPDEISARLEKGVRKFMYYLSYVIYHPRKTPKAIIERISRQRHCDPCLDPHPHYPHRVISNGILPRPFPCSRLVSGAVSLVDMCDLWYQRVVGVRVCEHRAD